MECRVCLGDERPETMLIPCRCRGTAAHVHDHCLRTYFTYYPDRICRVCHESMKHPWVDRERTLLCALLLLVWSAILVALSTVSAPLKGVTYSSVVLLLVVYIRYRHLTYEPTLLCLAASALLAWSDPQYILQTVCLAVGVLILATLCVVLPPHTAFLILVIILAVTYSGLFLLAVAAKTDPAFAAMGLMVMGIGWLTCLRPAHRNELYD